MGVKYYDLLCFAKMKEIMWRIKKLLYFNILPRFNFASGKILNK